MDKRTILVVDDEESESDLLTSVFGAARIPNPLRFVINGQEAIDYLAGNGQFADRGRNPIPCLVLLDLKMPGITGQEVLAWIRNQAALRSLVVIILSSSAFPLDVRNAYALGANSFIQKASSYEDTLAMANHLKGWWLERNCYPLD